MANLINLVLVPSAIGPAATSYDSPNGTVVFRTPRSPAVPSIGGGGSSSETRGPQIWPR